MLIQPPTMLSKCCFMRTFATLSKGEFDRLLRASRRPRMLRGTTALRCGRSRFMPHRSSRMSASYELELVLPTLSCQPGLSKADHQRTLLDWIRYKNSPLPQNTSSVTPTGPRTPNASRRVCASNHCRAGECRSRHQEPLVQLGGSLALDHHRKRNKRHRYPPAAG